MRIDSFSITPLREENNQMIYRLRFFDDTKGFTPKEQVSVEITQAWLKNLVIASNRTLEVSGSSPLDSKLCGTHLIAPPGNS